MSDAKRTKKCVMNFLVFPTPIGLDTLNFSIQEAFNMCLEPQKYTRGVCTIMHQIDPRKFTEIIDEADIIFETPNGLRCRAPYIREN